MSITRIQQETEIGHKMIYTMFIILWYPYTYNGIFYIDINAKDGIYSIITFSRYLDSHFDVMITITCTSYDNITILPQWCLPQKCDEFS